MKTKEQVKRRPELQEKINNVRQFVGVGLLTCDRAVIVSQFDSLMAGVAERDRLKEINAELLEVVKALATWYDAATDGKHQATGPSPYALLFDDENDLHTHVQAAIAKAEGR